MIETRTIVSPSVHILGVSKVVDRISRNGVDGVTFENRHGGPGGHEMVSDVRVEKPRKP